MLKPQQNRLQFQFFCPEAAVEPDNIISVFKGKIYNVAAAFPALLTLLEQADCSKSAILQPYPFT